MLGGDLSEADRLILEAATGARQLTPDDFRHVLEHVARAGFDPNAREEVRGRLAGVVWRGVTLRGKDRLAPVEVKYVWHVLTRQEWPPGTTLAGYVDSIRKVILDDASGVFVCRYEGVWQLSVARHSADLRGPGGSDWILVEYRVATGHWVTAFQPVVALEDELRSAKRDSIRWLQTRS